jgi:hypothetical protein
MLHAMQAPMKTRPRRTPDFLHALDKVQAETDAVFSVGVTSRCFADGSIPHKERVRVTDTYSLGTGNCTTKVVPTPSALSTSTCPP